MSYNLFLDDERKPVDVKWVNLPLVHWEIARNYDQFRDIINARGLPLRISFDHDLADEHYQEYFEASHPLNLSHRFRYEKMKEKTGYECAKLLVEYCMNHKLPVPEYFVHTMNPIGRDNIINYIEGYKRSLTS